MRFLRNRFIVGTFCIALGLAVSFIAIPRLSQNTRPESITAVRLTEDKTRGDPITKIDFEKISADSSSLPAGYLSDLDTSTDWFAAADLFAGDFLTPAKITEDRETLDPMLGATARGLNVVSISLPSLAASVSGRLQPGDIVTVMALPKTSTKERTQTLAPDVSDADLVSTDQPSDFSMENDSLILSAALDTVIYPALRFLEVCSINASDGSAARVFEYPIDEQKNILPMTISLFATEKQALLLAELEQRGIIHLSFVARSSDADQFIDPEKLIFGREGN